jgi:hypothetical protein
LAKNHVIPGISALGTDPAIEIAVLPVTCPDRPGDETR